MEIGGEALGLTNVEEVSGHGYEEARAGLATLDTIATTAVHAAIDSDRHEPAASLGGQVTHALAQAARPPTALPFVKAFGAVLEAAHVLDFARVQLGLAAEASHRP